MDLGSVRIEPREVPTDEVGWFLLARAVQNAIEGSELTRQYDGRHFVIKKDPFYATVGPSTVTALFTKEEIPSSWRLLVALRSINALDSNSVTLGVVRSTKSANASLRRPLSAIHESVVAFQGATLRGVTVNANVQQDGHTIALNVEYSVTDELVLAGASDLRLSDATEDYVSNLWLALQTTVERFSGGGEEDSVETH